MTAPDGITLSVVVAAPGAGVRPAAGSPVVVAVHGFASSAESGWGRTGHLDALTRAGRTVIALDLRGHGESAKPHDTGAYSLDAVLGDISAVVAEIPRLTADIAEDRVGFAEDRVGFAADPIDVIGYSLGSRLSWTAACRGVLRIRRMVLGGFDGRPLFEGVDTERLDKLAAGVPSNDRIALAALVQGLAGTGGAPESSPLPTIPTLLVAGDRDPLATRAEQFAAGLPHAEFLSIPGRSHISAVPSRAYRDRLVAFLAQ